VRWGARGGTRGARLDREQARGGVGCRVCMAASRLEKVPGKFLETSPAGIRIEHTQANCRGGEAVFLKARVGGCQVTSRERSPRGACPPQGQGYPYPNPNRIACAHLTRRSNVLRQLRLRQGPATACARRAIGLPDSSRTPPGLLPGLPPLSVCWCDGARLLGVPRLW
jgi:hypothetical protein